MDPRGGSWCITVLEEGPFAKRLGDRIGRERPRAPVGVDDRLADARARRLEPVPGVVPRRLGQLEVVRCVLEEDVGPAPRTPVTDIEQRAAGDTQLLALGVHPNRRGVVDLRVGGARVAVVVVERASGLDGVGLERDRADVTHCRISCRAIHPDHLAVLE